MTEQGKKTEREPEPAARALRRELFSDELLDRLMSKVDEGGVALTGAGGFLPELVKAVLERGMDAELTDHLGYEKHDPAGRGSGNSRNGTTPKTVGTEVGDIGLDQPRDRNSTFASKLVPKGVRRLGGLEEMIISLYAGGMTVRDIQYHLEATLGTEISHETISNVTEAVAEEVTAWQSRPLDPFYPVIYLDAIVVKIRDGAHVANRAAHIAVGVDMDGIKHVLGIWIQPSEGAKFWASVCSQLANRGVRDVLIVCCDGLTGFPEAVAATWSAATVQTCVVHLIRASMRFVSYDDRKAVAALLKPIYTAANEDAALMALTTFADSRLGKKYPSAVASWRDAWDRFTPFLAFGPALRKVIYTTNSAESLNYQLRKIIKNRGHFPSDAAATKLLWLAIMNIEDKSPTTSPRTRPARRPTQSPFPPRRRRHRPRLESRPKRTRPRLPRPHKRLPVNPPSRPTYTDNLTRSVSRKVDKLSCVRFGSARYSVPNRLIGTTVQLVVAEDRVQVFQGLSGELLAEHPLRAPGEVSILDEHYGSSRPDRPHRAARAKTVVEKRFLALGDTAEQFLIGAAAAGVSKLASELDQILVLQAAHGDPALLAALARAVQFQRWRADDVRSILAAAGAAPQPRPAGQALVLTLPAVPVRPLSDYAVGGDGQ